MTVTAYIQVTNGTFDASKLSATIKDNTTTILSLPAPPTVSTTGLPANYYKLTWSGALGSATTVATGHTLSATLTTTGSFTFNVLYDSYLYPSQISLPTTTSSSIISVDSISQYSAAHPGGSLITSVTSIPSTVYVRPVVSDPFGAYDIKSIDVAIQNPSGQTVVTTTLTDTNVVYPSPINQSARSKTYEYAWNLPAGASPGVYTILVTAHEGTEGITATAQTPFGVAVRPDLTLSKDDGGVTVVAGNGAAHTATYTLTYRNIGVGPANNVTITDTVPDNATFNAAASSPGWSLISGRTYQYNVPSPVAAGASGTVLFAVDVLKLPAGVTQLSNTATLATTDTESNTGNNSGSDTTPVTAAPDLKVTKTHTGSVDAGGSITYTISYSNVGTQDATGVVLTETLPTHTNSDPANLAAGWVQTGAYQFQCTLGSLAAGVSGTKSFTISVGTPVPAGWESFTNTVAIADDGTNGADLDSADNTSQDPTTVDAAPDLQVTKSDGGVQALPGGILLYTITYANIGNQDAAGVVLTETVPANTRFDLSHSDSGWDGGPSVVTLPIGNVAAGASGTTTLAVVVNSSVTGGTTLGNTITIADDGTSGTDSNTSNNTSSTSTMVAATPQADLAITKDDGVTTVTPGSAVTYTITVTNTGPNGVTGVTVTDAFPAALTGITWSRPADGTNPAASGSGNTLNDVIDLPKDLVVTYTVHATVAADATGSLTNIATVGKSGLADANSANNIAFDTDTIVRSADLAVAKVLEQTLTPHGLLVDADHSGTISPGDTVRFAVTVTNNSTQFAATGVALMDVLPNGYTYVGNDAAANGQTYSPDTGLWTVGTLAAASSATLHITATVLSSGTYENAVIVWASDNPDPVSSNNQASVTPTVARISDLSLSKLLTSYVENDHSGNLSGGDQVTFTLTLANAGPDAVTGATVKDRLPAGYTFVSYTSGGAYDPGTGIWTVISLSPTATITLDIKATVNPGFDPAAGAYRNDAQVWSSPNFDPDSTPGDNSTAQDDNATAFPLISDVSLAKSVALATGGDADNSGGISAGDTVIFTLTASNAGPDIATGVVVTDSLPAGYTYVSNDGGASYASGLVTWTTGAMSVAQSHVLHITATVASSVAAGAYANTAQVQTADNFDPNSTPGNYPANSENDNATVTPPLSDLKVVKSVAFATDGDMDDSGTLTAGDLVVFTVTVSDLGPDAATNVRVTDSLPAGYTYVNDDGGAAYNPNSGVWTVGTVAVGSPESLNITATIEATGSYTNVATLTNNGSLDTVSSNNSFSLTPSIDSAANLSLLKEITSVNPVPGGAIQFKLTLSNSGPDAATGVTVTDRLPAGYAFVSAVPASPETATQANNVVTWTVSDGVPVGTPRTLLINATLLAGFDPAAGAYTNYAEVATAGMFDPNSTPGNGSTTEDDNATATPALADLSLTKTANTTSPNVRGTVTFTITATNSGPHNATRVRATDVLPEGLQFVSATSTQGTYSSATGIWTIGTINSGTSATLNLTAYVLTSGVIQNLAQISAGDQFDPDSAPGNSVPTEDDLATATLVVPLSATIGNRIWLDENGNGVQDAGEEGIGGVTVQLTPPPGVDIGAGAGNPITTNAGAAGRYLFTGLPPGTYTVTVLTDSMPAGLRNLTYNPQGAADNQAVVTVAAGQESLGNDFGYNWVPASDSTNPAAGATGAIGNFIWNDANGNGIQDTGEPGLPDVRVTLTVTYPNGAVTTVVTTTDASGHYSFTSLLADERFNGIGTLATPGVGGGDEPVYVLSVTTPTGYAASPSDQGSDDTKDSDNPAGQIVSLVQGQTNDTYDFGFQLATGSVTGHLFIDSNGDGTQQNGEPNLPNIDVIITDRNGLTHTVASDADGNYTATDVPTGLASVHVNTSDPQFPAGYTQSAGTDPTTVTVVGRQTADAGIDGYQPPFGSLGDTVWLDRNGTRTREAGEPGLAGVRVFVDQNGNKTWDDGIDGPSALTGADGLYSISGLAPGTYTVCVDTGTLPLGLTATYDFDDQDGFNPGTLPNTPHVASVTLAAGENKTTVDFGYQGSASLGGYVWNDMNADGSQQTTEPPMAGVVVFLDLNGNGQPDSNEPSATTDANGLYTFGGLAAGTYQVTVQQTSLPLVSWPTYDLDDQDGFNPDTAPHTPNVASVQLVAGENKTTVAFGYQGYTKISDLVWLDANGDGVYTTGESGIGNVRVYIDLNHDGIFDPATEPSAMTDNNDPYKGLYKIEGLVTGPYQVRVDTTTLPSGLTPSYDFDGIGTPNLVNLNLLPNHQLVGIDFGYLGPGSISGTVINDLDGNGSQNGLEGGLPGVTVWLYKDNNGNGTYDAGDSPAGRTVTDGLGQYGFLSVPVGKYVVVETDPAGATSTNDADGNAYNNGYNNVFVDLTTTPSSQANNFYDTQPTLMPVRGSVYLDDGDNAFDNPLPGGDMGMGGVTVSLYGDANGNGSYDPGVDVLIRTTATSTDGSYAFQGLPNGTYFVIESTPEGATSVDDTDDATPPEKIDDRIKVTLSGSDSTGNNFLDSGISLYSISGAVHNDLDRDGVGPFEPGEPPIANVPFLVYADTNGNGTLDAGEPLVAQLIGGADGTYSFPNLIPGKYLVWKTDLQTDVVLARSTGDRDGGLWDEQAVDLTAGNSTGNWFLDYYPGTLTGRVYYDRNGNGTFDGGDQPLSDVTVLVTDVLGIAHTLTTDANGVWTMELPPGKTSVNVDETDLDFTAVMPAGWTLTQGSDPQDVTVVAGTSTNAVDEGYYTPATVTGHVYYDRNGNRTQDAGEPDLPDVDVVITDANGATQRVPTNASGNWTATVPPGSTSADVDETDNDFTAGVPAGWKRTEGTDPTTVTAVAASSVSAGNDGYYTPATVTGHLYLDTNGNHTQDTGEPDLADVDVIITDANGLTQRVTTDDQGNWTASVPPGSTTADVHETDPQFPAGATQAEGTDPTTVTAVAGQNTWAGNDGYYGAGTVSGHLYLDTNGNHTQDMGEPDLAGVDVLITPSSGLPFTVTTDTSGNWTATVPPGSTSADVDETDLQFPAGAVQTEGNDPTDVVAVAGGNTPAGNDGYQPQGSIRGHLFLDTDGDGMLDAVATGLANIRVIITDQFNNTYTVVTDANGDYTASGIPAGNANVTVYTADLPAGAVQTAGTDPTSVTVVGGTTVSAGLDGYQQRGSVSGHLFIDTNGNQTQDAGEPDLANITVLITDAYGGTRTVSTDANGDYTASGRPAGTVAVDVDNEDPDMPAGAVQTAGTDPTRVTVTGGDPADVGVDGYQQRGSISGHLFIDSNGNGTQDAGEPNLANIDVIVTDQFHPHNPYTVSTDANGNYIATGIPAGTATVTVDTTDPDFPRGAVQTVGTELTNVTVIGGTNVDAGVNGYQKTIGD